MASAQQKPKKEKGTRNSSRRSGKAWKNDMVTEKKVTLNLKGQETIQVVTIGARYGSNGTKLHGKGKPSGKSYLGVSKKRIEAQAKARDVSFDQVCYELKAKRDEKKASRKLLGREGLRLRVQAERERAKNLANAKDRKTRLNGVAA